MARFILALALFGLTPAQTRAGEIYDSYQNAQNQYLAGDYMKAAREYEYLVSLGTMDPVPTANLALMHRDMGQPQVAAAHWLKTTLLVGNDPFLWNMRAWNYLSLSRFREARDAFTKSVSHSTDSVHLAEAYFGLGLTDSIDGNYKAAIASLQKALAQGNPYLRSAADAELGRIAAAMRDRAKAVTFLTSSLSQDPRQPEIARFLGETYEKINQSKAAWQAYKFALDMSPNDPVALKQKAKMEKFIPGNPGDSLPLVRLARPMMRQPDKDAVNDEKSPKIRIQMFSGPDGRPRHLTKFYVMGSSTTQLFDIKLNEEIATANNFTQWQIVYRPDNRVLEIRDNSARIIYVTKQPFRLEAMVPGHTVLIKNPEVTDIRGMDSSDRELRGSIEVIPTPFGFHIVNELSLDQYLFSVIGQSLPRDELARNKHVPIEAYKALSVLLRSKIQRQMALAQPNPERTHTCDSSACLPYKGLTRERKRATTAVRQTRAMTISFSDGAQFDHHLACGWATASGIQDRSVPKLAFRHAYDLEELVHSFPDPEQFSEQSADVPQIWNRWVRVLDASELRANIERTKSLGPILSVEVTRRDSTGRVHALKISGARGEAELEGEGAIRAFLSPGSLRSTMFTLQPIYKGKKLQRLIVWGAGTGDGRGLCVAGTMGQAHFGRTFPHILRHYFPTVRFHGVPEKLLAVPKKQITAKKKEPVRRRRPRVRISTNVSSPGSKMRPPKKRRPPRRRRRPPSATPAAKSSASDQNPDNITPTVDVDTSQ